MCEVLYQRKQIILKNGALATMLLRENYTGLPFLNRSAPSNSVCPNCRLCGL